MRIGPVTNEMQVTTLWVSVWVWLKSVLGLAIPSAAVVLASMLALFRWSGKKWVEQLLSRNLEKFKSEQQRELETYKGNQQKELERLRHLLTTRVGKIHEKEFEILPKAWLMLNDLHGAVMRAVDLTMKYYPGLNSYSEAKLTAFLDGAGPSAMFADYQKRELREAEDKDAYYMDVLQKSYLTQADDKHRIFLNYLIEQRIFLTEELDTKLFDTQKALLSAITSYSVGTRAKNWELVNKGQQDMLDNMDGRVQEVRRAIQKRLHYEDAY